MKFLFLLLFISCVSQPTQNLDPAIYYKRDLSTEVNGFKSNGALVVPRSDSYKIKARFPGEGDLVTIKTCHREEEREDLGRRETIYFTPNKGMEDNGMCFLEIAVYEVKKGRHAWSIIDFENEKFTLPALVKCNGSTWNSRGTTICQSKEGLIQRIEFSEPVEMSPAVECSPLPLSEDKTIIEYESPNRECTYIIKGQSGNLHKLLTIGYEKLLIREL